ncbi:MAG TPA: redoxin family protein [Candidatus Acidoferrales bacterium]|nr:redoxin family protein [Candidatus Acidoferrales bacterium]
MKRWTFALPALALLLVVPALIALRAGYASAASAPVTVPSGRAPLAPVLAAGDWIDGRPTAATVAGKVVVVDVFTVDCGNCQNVVPTLRTLYAADRDRGLVVIGVHSPETPPEKDRSYVTDSLRRQGIVWPVAVDNEFNLWAAYGVSAWPTELFFDRHGRLRGTITGDSQDDSVKSTVAALLAERG